LRTLLSLLSRSCANPASRCETNTTASLLTRPSYPACGSPQIPSEGSRRGAPEESGWACRYRWLGESVEDFVCEPHAAVQDLAERPGDTTPDRIGDAQRQLTLLNMVAEEAGENRRASAALVREPSGWLMDEIERLTEGPTLFAPAFPGIERTQPTPVSKSARGPLGDRRIEPTLAA
jgi:hypothetical protein